ncbi:YpuI family protein [Cytobacillus sp. Hz8]|uniref:YpuI family protein n=1 Tax=Cytobacillus sp. Hz8 TaxID=3347168 RepID=UPI0035DEB678
MGNTMVKTQLEEVSLFLTNVVAKIENFLNETTITELMKEKNGDELYYKMLLASFRKILVYCDESLEACKIVLKSETFPKGAAEKTLYKIYHQCIEEFFTPKNDAWYEDSRSAYTGRNSIKFHQEAPESIKKMLKSLEGGFQRVREELEYYETDYRTKMIQSK